MSNLFYIIKLIKPDGEYGYVIDGKNGIALSVGAMHIDVTQFTSQYEAQKFINKNKLEKNGVKARIRSNQDLMEEEKGNGLKPVSKTLFYLENKQGEKCFYDSKEEGYYFENREHGYCVWNTEADIKNFCDNMPFPERPIIKKLTPSNLN